MVIAVTGSAGFIGSHIVETLINAGHQVIGLDSLMGGFSRNIHPESIFFKVDLHNDQLVKLIFKIYQPEVVYHIAADATEGRSQFTPVSATRNNLMASVNVFKNAIKYGCRRIIFTSSMSVYGDQEPPFDETMSPRPVDVYGTNKAATENILKILAKVHGVEYVIIRPHNVFGPRQNIRDAYRNVVGIFMNRVMSHQPPIIYGDGNQVRSFSYIDNLTPCLLNALDWDVSGEIFNLGPTETQTINELAFTILKTFNSDLEPTYVDDRPLEVKHAYCTSDKAESLLGYKTLVTFNEGIGLMVDWAKQLGPQKPMYLNKLELETDLTPITWKDKLI